MPPTCDGLRVQEKDYIRKEAAALFRERAGTSDPELVEQQVSDPALLTLQVLCLPCHQLAASLQVMQTNSLPLRRLHS